MKEPNHGYLASLVVKAQKGNMDSFSELYALTYDKAYNYACHYLRDSFLAQDAVQEVYILALKNLTKLNDPLLFIAWLNQISFRVCYDICKKKNADYGTVDDEILESICDDKPNANPEMQVERKDEITRLQSAINALPYLQRTIVIMRFYNDMKLSDIADAMDLSLSTVKRYIETAKQTLLSSLSY